jgi:hypothetical protein
MGRRKAKRAETTDAARSAESSPPTAAAPVALGEARFWLLPLVIFAGLLALYIGTLAPSVAGGDSGELAAAALTGGVPHPPGYPLFAMLARLFAALPFGPAPVWRVNLLSAVAMAGAAGLLVALVQLWTRDAAAALVAALLFGTNQVVWYHGTSVEIFGLGAFFVALAFLLWLAIERTASRRLVYALAFASGLGMCNQHTFIFVGLPLLARSLWVTRHALGRRGIATVLVVGLLGLAPYAYLVLASASPAAVSWGDETTWSGLFAHVLRRNYGTLALGPAAPGTGYTDAGTFLPNLWSLLGHALPRFAWLGVPLAVAGFYFAGRAQKRPAEIIVLAGTLAGYAVVFCELCNLATNAELYLTQVSRFFIQSDFALAVAAGLGAAELWGWLRGRWPLLERRPRLAFVLPGLVLVLGLVCNGGGASRRNQRVFADFAHAALASVPANAIVVTYGDHVSGAISYFHEVERVRPDVIHLDREMLSHPWYAARKRRLHPDLRLPAGSYGPRGYQIKQLLAGNPGRPLIVVDRLEDWDESWKQGHKLLSYGLVHELVPAGEFPTFAAWAARDRQAMGGYDVLPALRSPKGTWENALGQLVLVTQAVRAHIALVYSLERGKDPAAARAAMGLLEDIIAKAGGDAQLGIVGHAGLPPLSIGAPAWRDLGICYEILARFDPSYLPRVTLAVERFAEHAAPDNRELPAARQYLELHRRQEPPGP